MNKTILLFIIMLLPLMAMAQGDSRRVSVIPHAGLTVSKMDGNAINQGKKWKPGFIGGVEVEIPVADNLSITTGADYSVIGTGLKGGEDNIGNGYKAYTKYKNINASYVSVPLQVKAYLGNGFAFHIGIEGGLLVSAKSHYETKGVKAMNIDKDKASLLLWENFKKKGSEDVADNFRNFIADIPVGFSYEYRNIILNATYRFEVRKAIHQLPDGYENMAHYEPYTARNHAILITLGYRFRL